MKNRIFLLIIAVFAANFIVEAQTKEFVIKAIANELLNTEKSIVVLRNQNELIPIKNLGENTVALVSIGDSTQAATFRESCGLYTKISAYYLKSKSNLKDIERVTEKIATSQIFILHYSSKDTVFADSFKVLFEKIAKIQNSILCYSGNAQNLSKYYAYGKFKSLIYAPLSDLLIQSLLPQVIFGGLQATGKLAENLNGFKQGDGITTALATRFKYTWPEELGISSEDLRHTVDSIANLGIIEQAFPGCVVLAAKDRKVFFFKAYGYHTYYHNEPTRKDDLFDFASVTKISTSVAALLKLYDEGKFQLSDKISKYYEGFRKSNKEDIQFIDALTHTAKLTPFIPFYRDLVEKEGFYKKDFITGYPTKENTVRLTKTMFMNKKFQSEIYKAIKDSKLLDKKEYKYSDLSFMIYPKVVENITKTDFENFLKNNIYKPLGAYTLTFNPLNEFPANRIAPTENDNYFRNTLLQGYVHDEGSALLGGVSGHAGLFGCANDLAKLMQMYLQKGTYGDKRFFADSTLSRFNSTPYASLGIRRGIGFDKPYLTNSTMSYENSYPYQGVSTESFGHSGYTGTFTWVDPKNGSLLVFFTNRVNPVRTDKLSDLSLRKAMLKAFWDALKDK